MLVGVLPTLPQIFFSLCLLCPLLCSVSRETAFLGSFTNLSLLKSMGGTSGKQESVRRGEAGVFLPSHSASALPCSSRISCQTCPALLLGSSTPCGSYSPHIVPDSGIRYHPLLPVDFRPKGWDQLTSGGLITLWLPSHV